MKYDIERIQKEIQEIRRKYNEQKKREQINEENEKLLKMAWFNKIIINMHLFHSRQNLPPKNKFSYATAQEYCELVKKSIDRRQTSSRSSQRGSGLTSPLKALPKQT